MKSPSARSGKIRKHLWSPDSSSPDISTGRNILAVSDAVSVQLIFVKSKENEREVPPSFLDGEKELGVDIKPN